MGTGELQRVKVVFFFFVSFFLWKKWKKKQRTFMPGHSRCSNQRGGVHQLALNIGRHIGQKQRKQTLDPTPRCTAAVHGVPGWE